MQTGIVDQDIQPFPRLRDHLVDHLDLERGVGGDEDALVQALEGASVLIATSRLPITERVLAASPDLELIAKIGTGIDSIDLDAAAAEGITVTYTPGLNALSVAEHTLALLLAVLRHVPENQSLLRSGGWRDDSSMGRQLSRSTVGIVGLGDVGSRVSRLLSGFEVDVLAYDPYVEEVDAELPGAELTSLETLLRRSDAVTVNAELTEETRHMLGSEEFAAMKNSAVLVNTARGPVVDERALCEALKTGELIGAGLDVFETEPLPVSSRLHDVDNVVTSPHVAAMTTESRERCIDTLAENVCCILDGEDVSPRYLAVDAR